MADSHFSNWAAMYFNFYLNNFNVTVSCFVVLKAQFF